MRAYRALVASLCRLVRLNAGFVDELAATPRRLRWINAGAALLAVVATVAAFQEGRDQRMHLVAPDSIEAIAHSVAIDLSHRFHGTSGYVGRTEVLHTLFENGFTGRQDYLDKIGVQYPKNTEMSELLNETIRKALALRDLPKDASFENKRLFAPEANDPGIVDYISWSFDIFGFRVESFYYFYFLILGAAIVLFLVGFHGDALPLLSLAALMVAFLVLVSSNLFEGVWLRTVHNQRFLTSLCFVPYLHMLFTLLVYRRPTFLRVVTTVLQAGLFIFVMYTRSSAIWLILSFVLIIGLNVLFQLGRPERLARKTKAAALALSWPILLLAAGVVGSLGYKSASLHPIYGIGIFIPYHMVWHNAYMGLGIHPRWAEVGDKRDGKLLAEPLTDNAAWMGAAVEAHDRYGLGGTYLINLELGGLPGPKMALHERLIKERFLRFVFEHPRYMLELMLWHKPKWLVEALVSAYGKTNWNPWALLSPVAFLALAVAACRRLTVPPHVAKTITSALVITGLMSLLPPFWTYPVYHVLGETFLIWTAMLLGGATLLLNKAAAKAVAWRHA